ncbi:MAG: hypothetical protein PHH13_04175 [Candidatus Peribacteraceae bacterium]|nr:hypothetical protein [Candidatus Peribacteraceae bacterium]
MTPRSSSSYEHAVETGYGEGARQAEDWQDSLAQERCDETRQECLNRLRTLVISSKSGMYTERDFALYRDEALSDRSLALAGKETSEQRYEALWENLSEHIPQTAAHIKAMESTFDDMITRATDCHWISAEIAAYWRKRFASKAYFWWEKEKFLSERFPRYMRNWESLYGDQQKLNTLITEVSDAKNLPAVKRLTVGAFSKTKKFEEWRSAVHEALAAVEAHRRNRTVLLEEARKKLEAAAHNEVLSKYKVGTWLKRIVSSTVDSGKLLAFVCGDGGNSLSGLIQRWAEVRHRFDNIEKKRSIEGTPRGFHFVTTDQFLEWHFARRQAYVEEAERRFTNIDKENPQLLAIRRELDCQDWDEAAHLIAQVQVTDLSEEDLAKFRSMKRYLKESRPTSSSPTQELDPDAANGELNTAINAIPIISLRNLYWKAIRAGKARCLIALMYNRCWCYRNFYLNPLREEQLRLNAKEETAQRIEYGHGKEFENNDVNSYQKPAIRSYTETRANSAQVLHVSEEGHSALVARMQEEDCERFRYWSTLIPTNVEYGTHAYIVDSLHPRIKRCLRTLEQAGIPPTEQYQATVKHSRKKSPARASEANYAISA